MDATMAVGLAAGTNWAFRPCLRKMPFSWARKAGASSAYGTYPTLMFVTLPPPPAADPDPDESPPQPATVAAATTAAATTADRSRRYISLLRSTFRRQPRHGWISSMGRQRMSMTRPGPITFRVGLISAGH